MGVAVTTCPIACKWHPGDRAHIYLIQPAAAGLSETAPFTHRPSTSDCAWPSLQAAILADIAKPWDGPVFFVVPELTIDPSLVGELRDVWARTPKNRLLVAGLGHLTSAQCDSVESGVGATLTNWECAPATGLYANGALILPGPYLEAKNSPSKWERQQGCHWPGARLRVFQGDGFCFAVLICSDMSDEGARNDLLGKLSPFQLDAVFWLQHNPRPRHPDFQPLVEGLLDRHSKALIICANKAPVEGNRMEYGASGFLLRANRLEKDKRTMGRPNLVLEGASEAVARAVVTDYSAAVICIDTIHPGAIDIGSSDGARNRLLSSATPYDVETTRLVRREDARHISDLLAAGSADALARAKLTDKECSKFANRQATVMTVLRQSSEALALFLDHALLGKHPGKFHDGFQSHIPAAACRCWGHRENFDSLFSSTTSSAVAEMLIALAVLPDATTKFERRSNVSLRFGGSSHSVLLASGADMDSAAFEGAYSGGMQTELVARPAIVLNCRRKLLPGLDASRAAPRVFDAASSKGPMQARIYGDEFWSAVKDGTLDAVLGGLLQ